MSVATKLVEGWGKLRRFYLCKLRPGYVTRSLTRRRGACTRCGACCSIMFRCPHLNGVNQCGRYGKRYEQCIKFPIDERDLLPGCGFYFEKD